MKKQVYPVNWNHVSKINDQKNHLIRLLLSNFYFLWFKPYIKTNIQASIPVAKIKVKQSTDKKITTKQ